MCVALVIEQSTHLTYGRGVDVVEDTLDTGSSSELRNQILVLSEPSVNAVLELVGEAQNDFGDVPPGARGVLLSNVVQLLPLHGSQLIKVSSQLGQDLLDVLQEHARALLDEVASTQLVSNIPVGRVSLKVIVLTVASSLDGLLLVDVRLRPVNNPDVPELQVRDVCRFTGEDSTTLALRYADGADSFKRSFAGMNRRDSYFGATFSAKF